MLVRPVCRQMESRIAVCFRLPVRQALRLGDEADHVHAEAVDALLQPPVHHAENLVPHGGVIPVEVRLLFRKKMHIVHAGLFIVLPDTAAEAGAPVVRQTAVLLPLTPDIIVTVGVVPGRTGLDKPPVLVRAVVHHQIHDDFQAEGMGLFQHRVEIRHGTELSHDILIIADVIPVVVVGRLVDRREPDGVRAELTDIFKPAGDAGQVPDAVAIGVLKAARVNLIYGASLPPFFFHG